MYELEQAKRLLVYYFELAGAVRDNDNRSEIEYIVDMIYQAAKKAVDKNV